MGLEKYCMVDGSGLVWKHILVVHAGIKFPSGVRSILDDRLRRVVEHFAVDQ